MMNPRMRARRVAVARAQGRHRLRRLVIGTGAVAVLAGAAGIVVSPLLDVDALDVRGVEETRVGEVLTAAGIERGEPLLLFDAGAAVTRVESLAWVDRATVTRELPGTVRITVTPRRPVAWIRGDDGALYLVDRSGAVVGGATTAPDALPELIAGWGGPGATDGEVAMRLPDAMAGAAGVAGALGDELAGGVTAVLVERGRATLVLTEGPEVRLGSLSDVRVKVRAARAVLAALTGPVTYVDVQVPGAPVTG
jgi:cell division protein FtsQ